MNLASLTLGFAFLALGFSFRANAGKASDPVKAKNARFASTMLLIAAAAFLLAFAVSFLKSEPA